MEEEEKRKGAYSVFVFVDPCDCFNTEGVSHLSLVRGCTAVVCSLSKTETSWYADGKLGRVRLEALFSSVQSVRDSSLNRAKAIGHVSSLRYTCGVESVFSEFVAFMGMSDECCIDRKSVV